MSTALGGTRVLDLTRYFPGPYCTMLLGDLGADIIKVEEPGGDPTRGLPPLLDRDSSAHKALNRNKRSIVVDVRKEEGARIVKRLALKADVLVEAFRPGVLHRRGLGYEDLGLKNAGLVYCSLTGYGQDGPLRSHPGHDIDYLGLGGLLGAHRDAAARPLLPPAQIADMVGGLLACIGILAALQARERTGRGQFVDVSILEGVFAIMSVPLARMRGEGNLPSDLAGTQPCYRVYSCRDGKYVAVGALEPKFWEALCRGLGQPDLISKQWRPEAAVALERIFTERDRDEWLRELQALETCVEPVLDLSDVAGHPQARARRSILAQGSGAGSFWTPACPLRLSETPPSTRLEAPAAGEHTREVLLEIGYPEGEIERLRADGITG